MTPAAIRASNPARSTVRSPFSMLLSVVCGSCLFVLSSSAASAQPVPAHGLNPDFGTFSIGEVAIPLVATGGTGAYTWSIVSGTPPAGVVVRGDSASWPGWVNTSTTSAMLLGVAITPGIYNFTLAVTSGGQTVNQNAMIRITALTVGDTWRMPHGFVGKAFSHTLTALGAAGTTSWAVSGTPTLPAGLILNSATGVISGTPTVPFSSYINFRLTDGATTVFRQRYLQVFPFEVTSSPPNAVLGLPYSTTLAATGGAPPYTWSLDNSSLPTGLTMTSSGTISGIPTCCTGPWGFRVTTTDAVGRSSWTNLSIDLINSPQPAPRLDAYGRDKGWQDCTVGWGCDLGVSVFSGGTAPFTASISGQPPGLALGFRDDWWSRDILISGVPTQAGDFTIIVTVTGADGVSTTQDFPLHVSRLLQRHDDFRRLDLVDGRLGVPYSKTVIVTGGSPSPGPSYSVTVIDGTLPPGLTFDTATRTVSGTPLASGGFELALAYQDAVGNTLTVNDFFYIDGSVPGGTIDVTSSFDLGTLTVGNSTTRTFSACCAPSYSWTAIDPLPPGLTLSPDGVLSGTVTTAGVYSFLVRGSDAQNPGNYGLQRFTLTVLAAANPVVISSPSTLPYGNVDTPYNVVLAATGAVGAATWRAQFGNLLPPGLELAPDGTISGTPMGTGQFGFGVVVTDSAANTFTRFFTINVYPRGANPPLALAFGPSLGNFFRSQITFQLAATGGVGPYHYSLSPGALPIPGMRVQDGPPVPSGFTGTGALLGIPNVPGNYSSSIRVTDSAGTTLDRPFLFNVSPFHVLSQSSLPKATVGTPYSMMLEANSIDATPYFWSATNLPPGMSVLSTGLLSGTPTTAGNYSPRFTLTDPGTGHAITTTYFLVVDPFAITTNGNLPVGTIGTPYSQAFTAPGCVGCTWSILGTLSGLNFNGNVLSGTPAFTATTGFSFTIQAAGSNGTVQKLLNLVVKGSTQQPLFITTTSPLQDRSLGTSTAFSILAQGGTLPYTWTLESGSLPGGIELSEAGETLSSSLRPGTAYLAGRAVEVGVFVFTLRVTDAMGATTTKAFTWNVSPLAYSNTGFPITGTTLVYGQPYSQKLLAMGGSGVYVNWTALTAMPAGLSLNGATGEVSGIPQETGSINTSIRVTDDAGNAFVSLFFFNISGPTPTPISFGLGTNLGPDQQGSSTSRNLFLTGGIPPYSVEAITPLPAGYELLGGDELLSGAPINSWSLAGTALQPGAFSFTLRATDSVGNVGARTFNLSVAAFSRLSPQALANGSVGVPFFESLLAFSTTGAFSWSIAAGSALPPGLGLSPGGLVSGTPTTPGLYSFALTATDSAGIARTDTFTMVVSSLAIAGDAILPPATAGVPYTHTFTATGSSGTLVWSATGLPPGLTLSPNGTITGSATGVFGNFSPLVTVTDGVSPVTRRFTLVPVQPNPQPINVGSAATALTDATAGQLYTASLTGGRPPVTWTVAPGSALPAGLTLVSGALLPSNQTPGTTLLSGMPTAVGLYTFDLMATDAIGIQGRRTFTLRVSPLGVVIPGALRNPVVGTAYAQQLTVVGGTAPYSFSISPTFPTADLLPPGLSMSTGGLISGTALSTGSYAFRLKVTDSTGNVFTRTQSLTVTNAQNRFMISNFASIPDLSVGLGRTVTLIVSNAPANAAFTWSSVGPLPPGLQLVTGGSLAPNVATLAGRVATPGVYQFTVRATNNDDAADFVDRVFTARYAPIHLISPALNGAMPEGTVGVPYTASLKVAGGVPPYIFSESPFFPLPPGLSIASNGTVSGTPTRDGLLQLIYDVVDSAGNALAGIGGRTISINKPGSPSALAVPSTSAGTSVQLQEAFVGVPFADGLLDQRIRGGVPPYTWTVAAGSALPPGLSVLSGANGVSDRLGGTPTEQGEFDFSLTAFDASGQSLTLNFSIEVIPASLSANLVPGIVGTAYSVPLVATGGLPPYTFGLALGSDLPPGLTLGANGVFSGLPSHPGLFQPVVDISDSAGNTLSRRLRIAVDNSAGQAPALQVTPTPIQVLYIQGGPAPAPVSVSVATTSSLLPFGADVGGVPGASLSAGSGTTPSALDLTFNVTGLANGTYAGSIAVAAPGTVDQWNLVPVMLTVAAPPPCTYTLSKTATSVPAGGTPTPSYVNVTAGPTCAWTAVKSDSWITITSGGAGTGNGKLNYIVAANPSSAQRSGSITVANQTLVITQFGSSGCSFGINPVTVSPTAAGGMLPVSVAASNSTCSWSASSTSGLSLIPSGGAGSAVVNVTVPPNDQPAPRVLTATIAGQVFTVNQTGINCAVTLSPYEWTATATGAGGSIAVTTQNGCGYDTVLGPSWISVTSGASGVGSSTLFFDIAANSTTLPRTGTLSIGGQNFTVTQEALPCSVTMNTASLGSPYNVGGGAGSIAITANGPNCSWTASSLAPFASVQPGGGSGNGTVFVTVGSNAGSVNSRGGALLVNGQTVGILQAGTACTYALQSASGATPAAGGAGSVGVVAPSICTWGATTNTPAWLSITSAGTGGTGEVAFVAQPNLTTSQRIGTLTIAGPTGTPLTYTVTQAAASCNYTLPVTSITVAPMGDVAKEFSFTANAAGCAPAAVSYASWIKDVSTAIGGTAGTVSYSVESNPFSTQRTGTIQLGERTFTVTQIGGECGYSLAAYGALYSKAGGTGSVFGSPTASGCVPEVNVTQPFIIKATFGTPAPNVFQQDFGVQPYNVLTNSVRLGQIIFGGQVFTVKQSSW